MPTWWPKSAGRPDGRDVVRQRKREEKDLDARVMGLLDDLGFEVSRFQQPRPSGITAGVPDLLALHTGWKLAVWLELKRPGGKLSRAQEQWHATAIAAGQHVITVYSTADLVAGLISVGAPIRGQGTEVRGG